MRRCPLANQRLRALHYHTHGMPPRPVATALAEEGVIIASRSVWRPPPPRPEGVSTCRVAVPNPLIPEQIAAIEACGDVPSLPNFLCVSVWLSLSLSLSPPPSLSLSLSLRGCACACVCVCVSVSLSLSVPWLSTSASLRYIYVGRSRWKSTVSARLPPATWCEYQIVPSQMYILI